MVTWIFTKPIDAKKFKAVPGMPVPRKYSSKFALRMLRNTYGDDCVRPLDYSNPGEFLKMFESGDAAINEIRSVCERQAKTIREKDQEIKALRAQLKKGETHAN